jgi:hypothetical protein
MPPFGSKYEKRYPQAWRKPPASGSFRDKDDYVTRESMETSARSVKLSIEEAFEVMDQHWTMLYINGYTMYEDQYGFSILARHATQFELYHKNEYILSTYTLNGCKFVSLVLLNDKLNKNHVST